MKRSAPLVRKTPLRRTSPLRDAKPRRRRGLKRPVFPKALREEVWLRAGGRCDCCGEPLDPESWDAHHRKLRSRGGGDTLANLVALKHEHHMWCHENPAAATERGLIVSSWDDPAVTAIIRRDGTAWLPMGERWYAVCTVDGCNTRARTTRGAYCEKHYYRGSPDVVLPRPSMVGAENPSWTGGEITYEGMHQRLRKTLGPASEHPCVDCGTAARHWSYGHADPDERADDRGYPYSTDPDQYQPRCVSCHKQFDLNRRPVDPPEESP